MHIWANIYISHRSSGKPNGKTRTKDDKKKASKRAVIYGRAEKLSSNN